MRCIICKKEFVQTGEAVTCSRDCRNLLISQLNAGNSAEARSKAKVTMGFKFGVDFAMQSEEVKKKARASLLSKYGVDNAMKDRAVVEKALKTKEMRWNEFVRKEFPLKMVQSDPTLFRIDETKMQVFVLTEVASKCFLQHYGHRIAPRWGRKHCSLGLVKDGVLYQVVRFECNSKGTQLVDFGMRGAYFNPNYYTKLIQVATDTLCIDYYTCRVPRTAAVPQLVDSLSLELISEGMYEVYWIIDSKFRKLTRNDDVSEMKKKYDYVTTDYLDLYTKKADPSIVD